MGVLNVTPDSFSDGGKFLNSSLALDHAFQMIDEGAHIIDIGGESSKPGASAVPIDEEKKRILPVIEELRKQSPVYISVDTYKPEVMTAAIDLGVNMINDIKAMTSKGALDVILKSGVDVTLMHMQGNPSNMQKNPTYDSVTDDVTNFLKLRINACIDYGIDEKKIILDPGFGFGKTFDDNITLFKDINKFAELNYPLLIGVSRKSMIKKMVGNNPKDIIDASSFFASIAARNGANILRVHDVKKTKQMLFNLKAR